MWPVGRVVGIQQRLPVLVLWRARAVSPDGYGAGCVPPWAGVLGVVLRIPPSDVISP